VAEELSGKVRVFVFGLILRKKEITRDIDVLIVSPQLKTASQKIRFWRSFGRNLG
jgi:predicted nucleotidyltransferase